MISCPKCGKQFNGRSVGSHVWACDVTEEELFWNLVQKSDGCWPWIGAKHRDGYGRANVSIEGKKRIRIAHRMAWYFAHKELPPADKDVCHTCDNRICCNPAHLYLGTALQNMHDMHRRCRAATKLKPAQVLEIRAAFEGVKGKKAIGDLSRHFMAKYGVRFESIWAIRSRAKWRNAEQFISGGTS